MKFLFDFFPILLFFIAYKMAGIYVATATVIIASLIQLIISRIQKGLFEKIPVITFLTVTILGGATLFFRDELFIKWKPTAFYWIVGIGFLISNFVGQKPLIQRMLEQSGIRLLNKTWYQLNWAWVVFAMFMGCINLYVVYHFNTDSWVNFKLFGTTGITLAFIILQTIFMIYHRLPDEKESLEKGIKYE